jgi:hypothetical protein
MEACLYCNRTSDQIPLLSVRSQGQDYWICPQHLPVLIHTPEKLANILPGAGQLGAAEGH